MFDEPLHHLQRQRENDGGVLLGCDGVEALQVTQLESRGRLGDHQRGFFQSPGGLHLSLRSNDLKHRRTRSSLPPPLLFHGRSVSRGNPIKSSIIFPPHLCSGLPTGFCLCCHGSLQLLRQLHVLDLHSLHLNAPRISGFIQGFLRRIIQQQILHHIKPVYAPV